MSQPPDSRLGALIALVISILLVIGGVWVSGLLRSTSATQDCVMQGRTNC